MLFKLQNFLRHEINCKTINVSVSLFVCEISTAGEKSEASKFLTTFLVTEQERVLCQLYTLPNLTMHIRRTVSFHQISEIKYPRHV
jgi:hypothetical protein